MTAAAAVVDDVVVLVDGPFQLTGFGCTRCGSTMPPQVRVWTPATRSGVQISVTCLRCLHSHVLELGVDVEATLQ